MKYSHGFLLSFLLVLLFSVNAFAQLTDDLLYTRYGVATPNDYPNLIPAFENPANISIPSNYNIFFQLPFGYFIQDLKFKAPGVSESSDGSSYGMAPNFLLQFPILNPTPENLAGRLGIAIDIPYLRLMQKLEIMDLELEETRYTLWPRLGIAYTPVENISIGIRIGQIIGHKIETEYKEKGQKFSEEIEPPSLTTFEVGALFMPSKENRLGLVINKGGSEYDEDGGWTAMTQQFKIGYANVSPEENPRIINLNFEYWPETKVKGQPVLNERVTLSAGLEKDNGNRVLRGGLSLFKDLGDKDENSQAMGVNFGFGVGIPSGENFLFDIGATVGYAKAEYEISDRETLEMNIISLGAMLAIGGKY